MIYAKPNITRKNTLKIEALLLGGVHRNDD